jgi:hypothetical protein
VTFPPGTLAIRVEGAVGLYLNGYGIVIMTLSAGANALRIPARAAGACHPGRGSSGGRSVGAALRPLNRPGSDLGLGDLRWRGAHPGPCRVPGRRSWAVAGDVDLLNAKQLGRTARTFQYHWAALVDAGYITRTTDRRSGLTIITVTDLVRPPPMPEHPKRWPRLPQPLAGWKRRVAKGGAKLVAVIKTKASESALLETAVAAAEAGFAVRPLPS